MDIFSPKFPSLSTVLSPLSEGVVPVGFKRAIVSPLIKRPDEFKNYQHVSGLGFISKHIQRIVTSQLNYHAISNGLDNVLITAVLSIKDEVHLVLARGEATAVILLDQSVAFD